MKIFIKIIIIIIQIIMEITLIWNLTFQKEHLGWANWLLKTTTKNNPMRSPRFFPVY